MTTSPSPGWLAGAGALILLALTGCESTSPSTEPTPPRHVSMMARAAEEVPELQLRESMKKMRTGMSRATVLKLLGEPLRRIPATESADGMENWIYEIAHPTQYRDTTVEMVEVPYVDPITGESLSVLEPRTELERLQLVERFTISFGADQQVANLDYSPERIRQ